MIPIDSIKFDKYRSRDMDRLRGCLVFKHEVYLTSYAPKDVVDEIEKERIKSALWNKTYGELIPLIKELCVIAQMTSDPSGSFRAKDLTDKLWSMLDYKKRSVDAPNA